MTDVLTRNVPEADLARVDGRANRLGLSRGEYLRRRIMQDAARSQTPASQADIDRFARLSHDLLDDDVMRGAWS